MAWHLASIRLIWKLTFDDNEPHRHTHTHAVRGNPRKISIKPRKSFSIWFSNMYMYVRDARKNYSNLLWKLNLFASRSSMKWSSKPAIGWGSQEGSKRKKERNVKATVINNLDENLWWTAIFADGRWKAGIQCSTELSSRWKSKVVSRMVESGLKF
jgi:hypothetical protein